MGQCYSVELRMKPKNEVKTLEAIRDYMARNPYNANFSLEEWKSDGGETETMDGLVRLMLAGWKSTDMTVTTDEEGFTTYKNHFDASYGWWLVMEGFFQDIGPTLEDGSEFFVAGDSDSEEWTVENGEVI